ncbi:hypothetical protein MKY91_17305 [Alkalicoccobacillus gibsonii]|uniref:Lipoprotein n=1 Tax=Alkalicoccobacillus gibsonii TaxID=79881 RepID=A0ABU9VLX6_9BACI
MKQVCGVVLLSILLIGCSGKSLDEFEEEYAVDFYTEDIEDRVANLDENQIEGLLAYIEEYQAEGISDFDVLHHSDGEEGDFFGILLKEPDKDLPDYELYRMIRFDVDPSDDAFEPVRVTSGINGGGGVEWVELVEPTVRNSDGLITISSIGQWQAEFIYQGEMVMFDADDIWTVQFTEEELRAMEPVGNEE